MNGSTSTIDSMLQGLIDKRLQELGVDAKSFQKGPSADTSLMMAERVWRNNGWINPEDRYSYREGIERESQRITFSKLVDILNKKAKELEGKGLTDAVATTSAPMLLPKVVTRIIREAAEPVLVGASLLRRINYSAGNQIQFPASGGGMWAEDIPEGGEYPEQAMDFAGWVTANIGKCGLKVKITEEMIKYSLFDVMTMHLQGASRALARHKEVKIFNLISNEGRVTFDNDGGTSTHGMTTGRNVNLEFNKTITIDDLFVMYADMLNAGFVPNTLIMNPMGWLIFARDGTMRAFGFLNGGKLMTGSQGQPGRGPDMGSPNQGPSEGMATPGNLNPQATTYSNVPSLFPVPLEIVVSPFVYFNATYKRTDIIMADRNELGVMVVDEDPVTESWNDPERDLRSTKIRERYGLALDNQGEAVRQAKGVRCDRRHYAWEENASISYSVGTGYPLPTGFISD